jgi:hypothetical protein
MRKATLVAIVALAAGSACGLRSSAINERCLVYSGGTFEDAKFQEFLEPGVNNKDVGMGSTAYCYRNDQRSYLGKPQGGDAGPVEVVSATTSEGPGIRMSVDYQLYFKLNLDDEVLRRFHENLGVKTEAWTEDGWRQLLREYFEPQIDRAMESAALKHDWRRLYADEGGRAGFNADVIETLKQNIADVIRGNYFCGPSYNGPGTECGDFTFTVGKPQPVNGDIVNAVEAQQTSKAREEAQAAENRRIQAQLQAEREIVALYGPQGALLREAIASGKVSQFIIDETGRSTTPPR